VKRLLTVFVLCLAAVAAANDLRIVSARYGAEKEGERR